VRDDRAAANASRRIFITRTPISAVLRATPFFDEGHRTAAQGD
jgi:hypothetical protein